MGQYSSSLVAGSIVEPTYPPILKSMLVYVCLCMHFRVSDTPFIDEACCSRESCQGLGSSRELHFD